MSHGSVNVQNCAQAKPVKELGQPTGDLAITAAIKRSALLTMLENLREAAELHGSPGFEGPTSKSSHSIA